MDTTEWKGDPALLPAASAHRPPVAGVCGCQRGPRVCLYVFVCMRVCSVVLCSARENVAGWSLAVVVVALKMAGVGFVYYHVQRALIALLMRCPWTLCTLIACRVFVRSAKGSGYA